MKKLVLMSFLILIITFSWCLSAKTVYKDGVYRGKHAFITVKVSIHDGKITKIRILKHGGGGKKYRERVKPLKNSIIEQQSTDVDGITGATISSDHLKKAVEDALMKVQSE